MAGAIVFGVCAASQASLITIDFGPLAGANEDPYTGHVEDGFTVTPVQGEWFEGHQFGNPEPSIFAGPIFFPVQSAIQVTGGQFSFQSVDLSSNSRPDSPFLIEGFLNNVLVLSQAGTIDDINTFNLIASANPATVLDRLRIQITPADLETTSMNIDNIVLNVGNGTAPEPSGIALLGLGLAFLARIRRRSNA